MNKYIATINDNYIFTNRKGIQVNDLIYHYDKLGKRCSYCKGEGCIQSSEYIHCNTYDTSELCPKCDGEPYQGTGRITAQYKVVEVYDNDIEGEVKLTEDEFEILNELLNEYGKEPHFIIKLKLIKEVDYALSDFSSIKKEFVGYQTEYGEFIPKEHYRRDYSKLDKLGLSKSSCYDYIFKPLTRYNGLTKVLLKEVQVANAQKESESK